MEAGSRTWTRSLRRRRRNKSSVPGVATSTAVFKHLDIVASFANPTTELLATAVSFLDQYDSGLHATRADAAARAAMAGVDRELIPLSGPAEPLVPRRVMADHGVERVHRPVPRQARRASQRSPDQWRDDRIAGVLRRGLDDSPGDLRVVQALRVAAAQGRECVAGLRQVTGAQGSPDLSCRRAKGPGRDRGPGRCCGDRGPSGRAGAGADSTGVRNELGELF